MSVRSSPMTPNLMWGPDGVRVFTLDDGWGWIFTAIEHWNAECVGWHVCKRGDRFAALQPISMGLARSVCLDLRRYPGAGAGRADGSRLPVSVRTTSPTRCKFWGIQRCPTPSSNSPRPTAVAERFNRTLKEQIIHGRNLPQHRGAAERRLAGSSEQYACPVDRGEERLPEPRSSSSGVAHRDVTQARRHEANFVPPRNLERYGRCGSCRLSCKSRGWRSTAHFKGVFHPFVARTVNLSHLACHFPGRARSSSNYRRLQRFFEQVDFDYDRLAEFLVAMMGLQAGPWRLTMDRTNWRLGRRDVNILMIGIVNRAIAIPVCWRVLDKAGNSNTKERIAILEHVLRLFGVDKIASLLADREFIGDAWLAWLQEKAIPFHIRIRSNIKIANTRGRMVKAREAVSRPGQTRGKPHPLQRQAPLGGQKTQGQARLRRPRSISRAGELLIVVTRSTRPRRALAIYAQRWQIETLFAALKSTRGFNHRRHPHDRPGAHLQAHRRPFRSPSAGRTKSAIGSTRPSRSASKPTKGWQNPSSDTVSSG